MSTAYLHHARPGPPRPVAGRAVAGRAVAGRAVCVLLVALLVAASWASGGAAAHADPVNPSDAQIAAASAAKQALATQLGSLQAQAVALQAQLDQLQAAADEAIATYEQTTRELAVALNDAQAAAVDLTAATVAVSAARGVLHTLARDQYTNEPPSPLASVLLAADPADIDFAATASAYLAHRRDEGRRALDVATVRAANANSARRAALIRAEQLQQQADVQRAAALAALQASQAQEVQLRATLATVNDQAAQASAQLSGLLDQRVAFEAYQAELARQAAVRQAAAQAAAAAAAARAQAVRVAAPAAGSDGGASGGVAAPAPGPVGNGSWTRPLVKGTYSISSCYCVRWGTFHQGVDLAAPLGTPIYAVGAGTVVAAGPASGFGNWVVVDHHDGTVSIYGHMRVLATSVGTQVGPGTLIAYVGQEGQSTGPHLHFEVRVGSLNGPSTDPIVWLARRGVYL